jgi:hypothetical protein
MATAADLLVPLNKWAILSILSSDNNANVNTVGANVLKIKSSAAASYTSITVTAGAVTAKTVIRDDLNARFALASDPMPFTARIVAATNKIQIDTVAPNSGPSAYLQLDNAVGGSTLNALIGLPNGVTMTGLPVATLIAAVYPTPVTVDVTSATLNALSSFSLLTTAQQGLLLDGDDENGIADIVAPRLVETGPVLLSFVFGNISKLRNAAFQPGGDRIGLPAGVAVHVVADSGVAFTI